MRRRTLSETKAWKNALERLDKGGEQLSWLFSAPLDPEPLDTLGLQVTREIIEALNDLRDALGADVIPPKGGAS